MVCFVQTLGLQEAHEIRADVPVVRLGTSNALLPSHLTSDTRRQARHAATSAAYLLVSADSEAVVLLRGRHDLD